jgi:hypothetical protein
MLTHFNQILTVWGGKSATHRKISETVDEMGNVIDRSSTDTNITGIISPASYKENYYPPGSIQSGDLTAFFLYTDDDTVDVITTKQVSDSETRHDHIIYEDVEYRVEQLAEIAYDVDVSTVSHKPIFARYQLRKIAP